MTKIDHLGIAVKSIAAARGFYESLGLHVVQEETVEHEGVRVAMIPVDESRIELLEPTTEDSPVRKFLAKRGEGLHHVALHVDDISATLEALKAKGARLISDEIQIGAGGHFYFFVHPSSAGGVLLEICQDPIADVQMLLAIDTCGTSGSIALARREGERITVVGTAELAGKTYSATLVPRLRELLEEHHVGLQQIEAIIVVNGPGSFTGVRVGLSAVKGLAEVLVTPVIAVSRLRVLAHKTHARYAALDAGRGEFYFRDDEAAVPRESLLSKDELWEELQSPSTHHSSAVCEEKVAVLFPDARRVDPPTASDALLVATPRLLAKDFDDLATLDGNYLRRSDAELFAKSKSGALAGKSQ